MKILISLVLIIGFIYGANAVYKYWQDVEKKNPPTSQQQAAAAPAPAPAAGSSLSGLPPALEGSLQAAESQGASGLRIWLAENASKVRDPRLADIELDYVVLVSRSDLAEARTVFKRVKDRTRPGSPVYDRIKRLEKTYQ